MCSMLRPFTQCTYMCAVLASTALAAALVVTPFGKFRPECVVEVPHGSVVAEDEAGLVIRHDALGSWQHATPSTCRRAHLPGRVAAGGPSNQSCAGPPCTCSALPCNNWIDNAGYMTGRQTLGGFYSEYSVPETPTSKGAQTLFYFIGAENTDGTPRHGNPPPSGRAILQPVLTYDPSGWCKNGSKSEWCFSSWYCCPKNLVTHSPYILDVMPGERFAAWFNLTAPDMFEVVSKNIKTGQETTLKSPRQGRNFNWADVTQEVYAVSGCEEFAGGPMIFDKLRLWDTKGLPITPKWLITGGKPCGGTTTLLANGSIVVEHTP